MKRNTKINAKVIAKMNPCESRFDNYMLNYGSTFNGNIEDFILLEDIPYSDKVWVITRLFTPRQNIMWAFLCASKVLSIFETACPGDDRPRKALLACEAYLNNPNQANRIAADAAAAAADAAADAAYSAAAHASAYAVHYAASACCSVNSHYVTASAAYAAYYTSSSVASVAYDAANTDAAAAAKDIEEEVNLLLMVECLDLTPIKEIK